MADKGKNGKTRPFTSVNYSAAKLAREKQKREYEQQKKEKLIFSLFVVIILLMILFAILVFKNVLSSEDPQETESDIGAVQSDTESSSETEPEDVTGSAYRNEVVAKSDIYKGTLLLIDASHPYRGELPTLKNATEARQKFENASASSGFAYSFYLGDTQNTLLEEQTLKAFSTMADDFYKQTGIYDLYIPARSAYSEGAANSHASGRAFDLMAYPSPNVFLSLTDASYNGKFAPILQEHSKYGFISETCSDDVLHLLYVGIPHASYMAKNSLTLEAYLTKLRTEHAFAEDGKSHLAFTAEDGKSYEVYYVAASGDMVNIPVPKEGDYTISGDNLGGFLVTVTTT